MNDALTMIPQVAAAAQQHISWWAWFLNATGGAIKGAKRFCYLLAYYCVNGNWHYNDTQVGEMEGFAMVGTLVGADKNY
jgi:hypothetical protein